MTRGDWDAMYLASLYYERQAKLRTERDMNRVPIRRDPNLRALRDWVAAGFPKEVLD